MRTYLIYSGKLLLVLTIVVIGLWGCGKDTNPGLNEVFIEGMAFNPSILTIPVNTTVTWRNRDGIDHNVTSDDGLFDSGTIGDNGSFSVNFTTPGNFPYYCSIHPKMTGIIIVQSLNDTATTGF